MFSLLFTSLAIADPAPVVALGDGLVAAPPSRAVAADEGVTGSWLPVLADCLEERATAGFTVVDRSVVGETAKTVRERVATVREMRPAWVVLTLGARELSADAGNPKALRKDVEALVADLRKGRKRPSVILVGLVPPTMAQVPGGDPAQQAPMDEVAVAWNAELAAMADKDEGVTHLDLWSGWPRDAVPRGGLTVDGWALSDQGHARVAAAVCDRVLGP